jgi:hypothetical protein
MSVGGYKNANVVNPKGGYQEPSTIIAQIFDHKNGHYVRPNMVVLKYPIYIFKKMLIHMLMSECLILQ